MQDYYDMLSMYSALPSPRISVRTVSTGSSCATLSPPPMAMKQPTRQRPATRPVEYPVVRPFARPQRYRGQRQQVQNEQHNKMPPLWYRRGALQPRRIITNIVIKPMPPTPWLHRQFRAIKQQFA